MPVKLAEVLIESGSVTRPVMEEALKHQVIVGGCIDTVLLEQGSVLEGDLLDAVSRAAGLPVASPHLMSAPEQKAVHLFPLKLAERHCICPLVADGRVLHVAACYPVDGQVIEEISFMIGRDLRPKVALEVRVRQAIARAYGKPLSPRISGLVAVLATRPSSVRPPAAPPALQSEGLGAAIAKAMELAEPEQEFPVARPPPRPNPFQRPPRPLTEEPPPLQFFRVPPSENRTEAQPGDGAKAVFPPGRDPPPAAAAEPQPPLPHPTGPSSADSGWQAFPSPREPPAQEQPQLTSFPQPATGEQWALNEPSRTTTGLPGLRAEPAADPVLGWSLDKAREKLGSASSRDEAVDLALRFALGTFEFAAAFAVVGRTVVGWDARGGGDDVRTKVKTVSVSLDVPSLLSTVVATRGRYLGPVPADVTNTRVLDDLARGRPETVMLFPVEVRGRVVAVLFGDGGPRPVPVRRVEDFILFAHEIGRALERIILDQKQQGATRAGASPPPAVRDRAVVAEPIPPPGEFEWPVAEAKPETPASLLPTAAVAPQPPTEPLAAGVSADVVNRLLHGDPGVRAEAEAELAAAPEPAAQVLIARFPGPALRPRTPVAELPEATEIGPIPAALAKLGAAGALALAPVLSRDSVDVRYYAVLTAGATPATCLLAPVFQRTLDAHPVVASAARAAAAAFAAVPGFADQVALIRGELGSTDPTRVALAAKALAALRDVSSVAALVDLTDHRDKACAAAAAQALTTLCRQNFGASTRRWRSWWAENGAKSRTEWLIAALKHSDLEVRIAAFDELTRGGRNALGYSPEAPRREREAAAERWAQWWSSQTEAARKT